MEDHDYYLRTFTDLLYDSVYLLYFAFDINQRDYKDDVIKPHIRSSIMSSLLLLECGANCLLDSLDLPNHFYNDIDKLSMLSKFEYYLTTLNNGSIFDRGCKEIQVISELKQIRDTYVHPKVKKAKRVSMEENIWVHDFQESKMLKIPRDPRI